MPVTRVGAWCGRCKARPALHDNVCTSCENLLRAFGHDCTEYDAVIKPLPQTRFEALVAMGCAHTSDSAEFERDLQSWIS